MNVSKLIKSVAFMGNYLILLSILSCNSLKTYTGVAEGSDYILNGSVQKAILTDAKRFPWFAYEYGQYKPDTGIIKALMAKDSLISVMVFAGTWCSDTQRELPHFWKIMDAAHVSEKQICMVMLDRNKQCAYLNVAAMGITQIPTFIFYRNGKELGRIIENSEGKMEQTIAGFYP